MKARTISILMVMLSLGAAALLVAAADADDFIRLPSDGSEGLAGDEVTMASAAAEAAEEEETASRKKGGVLDEATRPWACCNSTVCTKSSPPTCRCLDAVDECAAACQQCEPSIVNPFRHVCNDEYHGDPGPTCPNDDEKPTRPWACCNSTVCTKSSPPMCRCLDAVDECAAACQKCELSIFDPSRYVCNDEYHGDPGPTCPDDDDEPTRPWACCNSTVCTKSSPPTCRCLDAVDQCAAACKKCEPSIFDPSRYVCNDEYHGDPGPTCPDDDVPSGASRSIAVAARLLLAFIALLFIQSR